MLDQTPQVNSFSRLFNKNSNKCLICLFFGIICCISFTEKNPMPTLTPKQEEILSAIRLHIRNTGQSPTIREIGQSVGLKSSCSVQKQIETLERLGQIHRSNFKYRSIEIVGENKPLATISEMLQIPVMGQVVGGNPKEVFQDPDPELISLPISLLPRVDQIRQNNSCEEQRFFDAPLFAMRVQGHSMVDAGIDDGDLVIARQQSTAENGDIVIAAVEDYDATVKKYYRDAGRIRLQPANDLFEPIYSEYVQIIGKVALAIKQF
jgi:repressor LexA